MREDSFRLEVYAFGNRNKAIEMCRESLLNNAADIFDFKMFSDMLVNFNIEIPKHKLVDLQKTLISLDWIAELKYKNGLFPNESISLIQGTMAVTFVSGTGEKKDIIPAVPG